MNDTLRIAQALDLAVLQPNARSGDVRDAACAVEEYDLASVCVAPCNVQLARLHTARVCAVIGFPHGNTLSEVKRMEARRAIDYGACELDVVVNYGRHLEGNFEVLKPELQSIVWDAHSVGVKVKAILETCYYTPEQIRVACRQCIGAGVDWVKTSTGFAAGGATPEAVKIMLEAANGVVQVKASGGIKTRADALMYLDLGCTRLGAGRYKELIL
jgi:deoxyribose-phosphate aldolase